jgi:hypothetical protein
LVGAIRQERLESLDLGEGRGLALQCGFCLCVRPRLRCPRLFQLRMLPFQLRPSLLRRRGQLGHAALGAALLAQEARCAASQDMGSELRQR